MGADGMRDTARGRANSALMTPDHRRRRSTQRRTREEVTSDLWKRLQSHAAMATSNTKVGGTSTVDPTAHLL